MSDISQIALNGVTYKVKDTEARNTASGKVNTNGGDISLTKITAESVTTEFPVPASGDTAKKFLGKMKKFCEDLNNFKSGIVTLGKIINNGLCNQEGFVLDARQANPNIENTMAWKINKQSSDFTNLETKVSAIPLIKYGTVTCAYRDVSYLQATVDVSAFKSYKIYLSFDADTDGFLTNDPHLFNVNNTIYIRSGKGNFISGAGISVAYLIVGVAK